MRFLIALMLSGGTAFCAGHVGFYRPFERAEAGYIVQDYFERSSIGTDWLAQAGASAAIYNSNVLLVGSVSIDDWFAFTNWYTCAEDIVVEWRQYAVTTNATTSGIYFGWRAASASTTRSIWMGLYGATDTDFGKVKIGKNDNTTFTEIREAPAGRAVTGFGQTWVDMKVARTQNVFHVYATNPANGSYSHTNFTFELRESGNITPVASYFGFNVIGGSNLIDDLRITLNRRVPMDLLIVGKSIDDGSSATNAQERYFNMLSTNFADWPQAMNAGGFNYTSNYLRLFPEHLRYHAKHVWMGYPTDLIAGVASNTWSANVFQYVTNARAYGLDVNVMAATPNNSADYRPWNLYVSNNLAGNNVVYAGWDQMRTNNSEIVSVLAVADLVHLNNLGHLTQYNAMLPRRARP